MKRIGKLWKDFISLENLRKAYKKARRGRGNRKTVIDFEEGLEHNLRTLQKELVEGTWTSSEYRFFTINEKGKDRLIATLPFRDRVVHWALINVTRNIFERPLVSFTYACVKKRGTSYGLRRVHHDVRKDGYDYCYKMDIHHYFPSIDKDTLYDKVCRIIKDKRILLIIADIIYRYPRAGIPIGNLTSQYFANLYLSRMDHWLSEKYHAKCRHRYMDDYVVIGRSKRWLHRLHNRMIRELKKEALTIKPTWQVFPVESRGIDFLGFITRRSYTLVRQRTKRTMKRKSKMIPPGELDVHEMGCVASYHGVLMQCDGFRLHQRHLGMWIAYA
jgi:retron-type reverse transcriptase